MIFDDLTIHWLKKELSGGSDGYPGSWEDSCHSFCCHSVAKDVNCRTCKAPPGPTKMINNWDPRGIFNQ